MLLFSVLFWCREFFECTVFFLSLFFARDSNMIFNKYNSVQVSWSIIVLVNGELRKSLSYKGLRQLTFETEVGPRVSDRIFYCKCFAFYMLFCKQILLKNVLLCKINPTYLMGCCECFLVQPCTQDNFMFCTNIQYTMGFCEY